MSQVEYTGLPEKRTALLDKQIELMEAYHTLTMSMHEEGWKHLDAVPGAMAQFKIKTLPQTRPSLENAPSSPPTKPILVWNKCKNKYIWGAALTLVAEISLALIALAVLLVFVALEASGPFLALSSLLFLLSLPGLVVWGILTFPKDSLNNWAEAYAKWKKDRAAWEQQIAELESVLNERYSAKKVEEYLEKCKTFEANLKNAVSLCNDKFGEEAKLSWEKFEKMVGQWQTKTDELDEQLIEFERQVDELQIASISLVGELDPIFISGLKDLREFKELNWKDLQDVKAFI